MNKVSISPFIDKYHPQKDGKCGISIRVTYQRKKRFYPTGISLDANEFERIMTAKRRNEKDSEYYRRIIAFVNKVHESSENLPVFTFNKFDELYFENREAADSVFYGFEKYIAELRAEKRIGTATSYETAKNSLESFRKILKYADVDKAFLQQYENWMLEQSKSKTTIGIYLRSLRTIFNRANVDKSLYAFGEGKGKYSIPTSRNIKKSLTMEDISKIFYYKTENNAEQKARDYWLFIYLCNGLNVKDFCELKRKNIERDVLSFERAKTKRTRRDSEKIIVSLKPEAKEIIKKWGQLSLDPDSYIFPHLQKGFSPEYERQVIQQVTKTINKYMKRIALKLQIARPITTYYARHSFATILKNSGVSVEFISEALGHSDVKTTKNYLSGFEESKIHETTNVLTAFTR